MINAAFFNQYFLVQNEVIGALKRLPEIRVLIVDIADRPTPEQAEKACEVLRENHCGVVFTINEWGLDEAGVIARYIAMISALHVNWCVDDPFFMEIFHDRPLKSAFNRLDFVSNRAYVEPLRAKGFIAHFLPLATDPSLFFPFSGNTGYKRNVCFVGNSYRKQLDEFCAGHGDFLQRLVPFMGEALKNRESDVTTDISFPFPCPPARRISLSSILYPTCSERGSCAAWRAPTRILWCSAMSSGSATCPRNKYRSPWVIIRTSIKPMEKPESISTSIASSSLKA
jgi:hypothetical protein